MNGAKVAPTYHFAQSRYLNGDVKYNDEMAPSGTVFIMNFSKIDTQHLSLTESQDRRPDARLADYSGPKGNYLVVSVQDLLNSSGLKMEVVCSFEMLIITYKLTRLFCPEVPKSTSRRRCSRFVSLFFTQKEEVRADL